MFSVQLGIQTLPSLLSGELFPSDVRAFGKGLTRSATCGFMLISLKVYPILSANLGKKIDLGFLYCATKIVMTYCEKKLF